MFNLSALLFSLKIKYKVMAGIIKSMHLFHAADPSNAKKTEPAFQPKKSHKNKSSRFNKNLILLSRINNKKKKPANTSFV